MKHKPSEQQEMIFDWFDRASGCLVIRARAGTGKTTTIVEGINFAHERSILLAAFNKGIADTLATELRNPFSRAQTLNSLGYGYVRKHWHGVGVVDTRNHETPRVIEQARYVAGQDTHHEMIALVAKLATRGKEMAPLAKGPEDLEDLAYEFDCVPDEDWDDVGWDLEKVADKAYDVMEIATQKAAKIDFADQIYLPIRNKWISGQKDLIVVDEAQDMNASQIMLAHKSLKRGGRIAVVGDDRQAIYGFRGADTEVLDRMKTQFNAVELGLTITYRCPQMIVAQAQRLVPDYQASPLAPVGNISSQTSIARMIELIQPGDFLLSRTNAPIVGLCLKILREGKRARVQGRDIGAGLISLVNHWKAKSMPEFLIRLRNWEARECIRAKASGSEHADDREDYVRDKAETLRYLAEGLASVAELQQRIYNLFTDDKDQPEVRCSSIHKAKGLESRNVFVMENTLRSRFDPPCTCHHWAHKGKKCAKCDCERYTPDAKKLMEEQNLEYVAITRTKENLYMVQGDNKE